MPKKVLMFGMPVHPVPPLKGAAVETWMYEVSKRLVSFETHIVSIYTPYYPEKEYRDGVYFHRVKFNPLIKGFFKKMTKLDPLSYSKSVLQIINDVKPDIVHIHNNVKYAFQIIDKLNNKIKFILHFHNEIKIQQKIAMDALVGCSEYIVESYKKNDKVKAKLFRHLYNGVDLEKFRAYWKVLDIRQSIRKRFNIKNNEFVVLFVGRVSPEKGVEHFVEIATTFKDIENIKFFIIGEISKKGGRYEYAKDLIQKANSLKDKIIFTDVFPPSKIHLIYLIGDIVMLTSNFEEPFGMVAIEAMATGLPVIARQKGGLKEFIQHGINGFFVREHEIIEDSSKLIQKLMGDEAFKEHISKKGRETVENFFSWDTNAENTECFYRELLGTGI